MMQQKISPQGYFKLCDRILQGEINGEDVTREAMIELNLLPVPTVLVVDWSADENIAKATGGE